ncbi:MAG: hypothetical protein IJS61_03460 [Firmicutes bacterium]|nr:hypothetical protein [Bacillota bacterium]
MHENRATERKIKEISKLKNKLKATDYKVLKAYEASLTKKKVDIDGVIKERESMREEIRRLEAELDKEVDI